MLARSPRLPRAGRRARRASTRGRFTAVFFPQRRAARATSLLAARPRDRHFPWLPRPRQRVLIAHRARRAAVPRSGSGPGAPEWGAALAFPESRRIIMQGARRGSDAGDPLETLRHELAHLALHERLGDLPPRWFDEGYASCRGARVEARRRARGERRARAARDARRSTSSTTSFIGGATRRSTRMR